MLLHFALKVLTFCITITFCGKSYYILRYYYILWQKLLHFASLLHFVSVIAIRGITNPYKASVRRLRQKNWPRKGDQHDDSCQEQPHRFSTGATTANHSNTCLACDKFLAMDVNQRAQLDKEKRSRFSCFESPDY